jgi:hypothetical protein
LVEGERVRSILLYSSSIELIIRILPITSSSNKERCEAYIAAGDVELSEDQIKEIDHAGEKGAEARVQAQRMRDYGKSLAMIAVGAFFTFKGWRIFM